MDQSIAHGPGRDGAQQIRDGIVQLDGLLGFDRVSRVPTVLQDAGQLCFGIAEYRLELLGVEVAYDLQLRIVSFADLLETSFVLSQRCTASGFAQIVSSSLA